MCGAFDEQGLAILQRAYDEVLQDLFGDVVPELRIRESIACAILCSAKSGQNDWEKMAVYASTQTLRMLRERSLLMRHDPVPQPSETKVA